MGGLFPDSKVIENTDSRGVELVGICKQEHNKATMNCACGNGASPSF